MYFSDLCELQFSLNIHTITMAANLHFNPFPSAPEPQHAVEVPSHITSTCVHIREEDSHCEQCRQQIRSMSRSTPTLQHSPQQVISPTLGRHSADLSSTRVDALRQRRRASHCPSASDPSMGLFPSSSKESTTPVSAHPWRKSRGLRQLPVAGSQVRGPPESGNITSIPDSPGDASSHSNSHVSAGAA